MNEELTPAVYENMNKEFIKEDLPFRVTIPTQEQIDNASNDKEEYEQHDNNLIVIPQEGVLSEKDIELHFGSIYESEIDEMIEEDVL